MTTNISEPNYSVSTPINAQCHQQSDSSSDEIKWDKSSLLNVDQILEEIVRPSGLWQWSLTILLLLSSTSIATFDVFANSASPHRCRMEDDIEQQFDLLNLSFGQAAALIGPWPSNDTSEFIPNRGNYGCYRYARQMLTTSQILRQFGNLTLSIRMTNATLEKCPFGYVHQPSSHHYPQSVVKEFQVVCHQSWFVPLGTSIFIIGMMFGFIVGGYCGDRFGRKKTLLLFTCIECLAALGTSLSPNYVLFVLGRALMGLGNTGKVNVEHVLLLELTIPKYRSTFGVTVSLGTNCLYRALLALWAFYVPDWRWLNIITMGPNLLSILYIWFLPESPRWLNSKGKYVDALEVMKTGYRINHLCRDKQGLIKLDQMLERIKDLELMNIQEPSSTNHTNEVKDQTTEKVNIWIMIFSSRVLIKSIVLSSLMIAGISMSFLGILFYARTLWNYVYLTSFINSMTSIPSALISILLYRYIKYRKRPLFGTIATASCTLIISSLYTIIYRPNTDILLTICSNIALILINASTSMCFVYIPEMFPSELRTHGFGLALGLGRLGSMFCPFVNELDKIVGHGTPLAVFALVLTLELFVLWTLPDTRGENLPDNLKKTTQYGEKSSANMSIRL